MTSVAEALRGLRIPAKEIADRSRLSTDRVREILDGSRVAVSELRAISVGLRLPLHVLAKGHRPSEVSSIAPLFRTARGASQDFDITIEKIATFVDAALTLLPERTSLPAWLMELSVADTSYASADQLSKRFRELAYERPEEDPATDLPDVLGRFEGVIVSRLLFSRYEGFAQIPRTDAFYFRS